MSLKSMPHTNDEVGKDGVLLKDIEQWECEGEKLHTLEETRTDPFASQISSGSVRVRYTRTFPHKEERHGR